MASYFIVIDGMDGSGKTEAITRLHNHLYKKNKRYRILTTKEPTYGTWGQQVRKIIAEEKDPGASAEKCLELYVKDREEHLKKTVVPFLNQPDGDNVNIVLCDRYYYSTIAFQHAQGIPIERLIALNAGFRKPDIAFIFDIPPEMALNRMKGRAKLEKFEELDFMKKLRENFLHLKEIMPDSIIIVDASAGKQTVFGNVRKEVEKRLGL